MHAKAEIGGLSRLSTLTAGDLINGEVAVLSSRLSMHQAAHKFAQLGVGAMPVVDNAGQCIGILSARDFVTYEIDRVGEHTPPTARSCNQPAKGELLPWNSVQKFMSTAVQTTPFNSPVLRVSEIMIAEHIHHLVVLDGETKPIGVISTIDVLSALVAMVDEQKSMQATQGSD